MSSFIGIIVPNGVFNSSGSTAQRSENIFCTADTAVQVFVVAIIFSFVCVCVKTGMGIDRLFFKVDVGPDRMHLSLPIISSIVTSSISTM